MTKISDELSVILKQKKVNQKNISTVKKYLKASKMYDSLIESGLTSKRGNNLMSRNEAYTQKIKFNIRP
ncbi:hypothetical protein [Flagellimonas sp.]|uniref:hypothetical protein n=1 Tax=Flagellimonas sp. TaxID=2058762 RepID=UPI003B511EAC